MAAFVQDAPEDLIETILGTIPSVPYSVLVKESTAKGVGGYFHRAWLDAAEGRSSETPVFVAWHEIEIYARPICAAFDYEHPHGAGIDGLAAEDIAQAHLCRGERRNAPA